MANKTYDFGPEMTSDERLTILDLVAAVQDAAESDAEVVATLRHMAETGHFQFEGVAIEDLSRAA